MRNEGTQEEYETANREFKRVFQKLKRQYQRKVALDIAHSKNPFQGLYSIMPALKKKRKANSFLQKLWSGENGQ